jgi:serine/threonine protein kinase
MRDRSHINICMFLGACTEPGNFRIVTELMDGDVDGLIHGSKTKKPVPLSLYQKLCIVRDAAKGILWLHKTDPPIIHRDLKPANILVRNEGRGNYTVKVTDFGLSAMKKRNKRLKDGADGAKGTPLYMAPEVLLMEPFDEKADTYAFGVCLWEILTGDDPFAEHDDYDRFKSAVVRGERPRIPATMPIKLQEFLARLWHQSPSKRYDFQRIVEKLNSFIVDSTVEDPVGSEFWKTYFVGEESVPVDTWLRKLFEFSNLRLGSVDVATVKPSAPTSFYEDTSYDETPAPAAAASAAASAASGGTEAEQLIRLLKQMFLVSSSDDRITLERFGFVLHWHGPMSKSPAWIDALRRRVRQPWFFGDYSAQQAESHLASEQPGAYLVRYSSNPGAYTIVRKHDAGIGHIRVNRTPNGFEIHNTTYPDLHTLIETSGPAYQLQRAAKGSPYQAYL